MEPGASALIETLASRFDTGVHPRVRLGTHRDHRVRLLTKEPLHRRDVPQLLVRPLADQRRRQTREDRYHHRQPAPRDDLTVDRPQQRLGRGPLAAYAGVDNLFDRAYEESYGFPQAGRVAYLGLDLGR